MTSIMPLAGSYEAGTCSRLSRARPPEGRVRVESPFVPFLPVHTNGAFRSDDEHHALGRVVRRGDVQQAVAGEAPGGEGEGRVPLRALLAGAHERRLPI